jgi:DNA-binding NarL/FixJ family response regulator
MRQDAKQQNNVVIVSRPGIMQQSLRAALAAIPWLRLVGTAGDGLTALNLIQQQQPDLLLLDSNLLEEERMSLLQQVKQHWPTIRCLALVDLTWQRQKMLAAGADAALLRQASNEHLYQTLKEMHRCPETGKTAAGSPTILLVDDDAKFLAWLETVLQQSRSNLIILTAKNGGEAWQQYQAHLPDLLWTDYRMPNLNGLSLIRRVRAMSPDIAIVLMTEHGSQIAADFSQWLNIYYLAKPFTPEQAQHLINTLT